MSFCWKALSQTWSILDKAARDSTSTLLSSLLVCPPRHTGYQALIPQTKWKVLLRTSLDKVAFFFRPPKQTSHIPASVLLRCLPWCRPAATPSPHGCGQSIHYRRNINISGGLKHDNLSASKALKTYRLPAITERTIQQGRLL